MNRRGFPLMLTTWNSFTWMWNVCHSGLRFTSVHSSSESSFIVRTRLGSNVWPLSGKATGPGWPGAAPTRSKTIVRRRSTRWRRRSTRWRKGLRGMRREVRRPADFRVTTLWFGVGPPPAAVFWPGSCANGSARIV